MYNIQNKHRSILYKLSLVLLFFLLISVWNSILPFYLISFLAGLNALGFCIAFYSFKDFLSPYPFSLWKGKFLKNRKLNIDLEALEAKAGGIKELLVLQKKQGLKKYLFYTRCFSFFITPALFTGALTFFINSFLNNPLYTNYQNGIVKSASLSFIFFSIIISTLILIEFFRIPLYLQKVFPDNTLTKSKLDEFHKIYKNSGITDSLGFENLLINILAYCRLGILCRENKDKELLIYWQSTILYKELALEFIDDKKFTQSVNNLLRYIDKNIIQIDNNKKIE